MTLEDLVREVFPDLIERDNGELYTNCPFCEEKGETRDTRKRLGINHERGTWQCFNCFVGTEKFMTKRGLKTFLETVGTKQKVLNKKGKWVKAYIRSFGKQRIFEVVLKPGNTRTNVRIKIKTTENHRWFTLNRGEVTNLKRRDSIPFIGVSNSNFEFDAKAWIRGFGFGDGTINNRGRAVVRLCKDKNKWIERFKAFGHSEIYYCPSNEGDALVYFDEGYMCNWKKIPYNHKTDINYLANWLEGYLAAGGDHCDYRQGLYSQNVKALEFVKEIAPYAGYLITGESVASSKETNLGRRSSPVIHIYLRKEGFFTVESIKKLDLKEEVFCVTEPETHSFVLANGVLTGNCHHSGRDNPEWLFRELVRIFDLDRTEYIFSWRSSMEKEQVHQRKELRPVSLPKEFEPLWEKSHERIHKKALEYVLNRGVTLQQIENHFIGFCAVGDYAGRIIFPVYRKEQVIGFVARAFAKDIEPRYLNSEGLRYVWNAPDEKMKYGILIEGVFDALAGERVLHKIHIMAGLGHTLTDLQLKPLLKFRELTLVPDPDRVGIVGTVKRARSILQEKPNIKLFVIMPQEGTYEDWGKWGESRKGLKTIKREFERRVLWTKYVEAKLRMAAASM